MFPKQAEFNMHGYLMLLGIFLFIYIIYSLSERKMSADLKSGFSFKAFISLFGLMIFLLLFEELMETTYYIKIGMGDPDKYGTPYATLFGTLFIVLFGFGLYTFMVTILYSIYKFQFKGEMTRAMHKWLMFIKKE